MLVQPHQPHVKHVHPINMHQKVLQHVIHAKVELMKLQVDQENVLLVQLERIIKIMEVLETQHA